MSSTSNSPMSGPWTRSTPALIAALGRLKLEVSRAQDAVQAGTRIPTSLAPAVADVKALDLRVAQEQLDT